jgi:hypothetical protein
VFPRKAPAQGREPRDAYNLNSSAVISEFISGTSNGKFRK